MPIKTLGSFSPNLILIVLGITICSKLNKITLKNSKFLIVAFTLRLLIMPIISCIVVFTLNNLQIIDDPILSFVI